MPISKILRLEKFLEKVDTTGTCWLWKGSHGKQAHAKVHGKMTSASRVAWILFVGEIPSNLFVLHTCDNPMCVRISHLFLGNHQNNMDDMVSKKRSLSGERNPAAKMSNATAILIRKDFADGVRQCDISRKYNVHKCCVSDVLNNRTFKGIG